MNITQSTNTVFDLNAEIFLNELQRHFSKMHLGLTSLFFMIPRNVQLDLF